MSPVDEWGNTVPIYPHRIVFLVPRLVNEQTPAGVRQWLNFINDSLDGSIDESGYDKAPFPQMIKAIETQTIDPAVLSEIKDEAAWEKAKTRFTQEGWEEGHEKGREEGLEEGLEKGREEGLEKGEKQGILAQQRQTVRGAQKMGMEIKAIAALVGLTETAVQEMLK
jgi:flagellar biosynthesis/type III secretory pathway protein FliH